MELREAINCQGREGKRCWQNKKKFSLCFYCIVVPSEMAPLLTVSDTDGFVCMSKQK